MAEVANADGNRVRAEVPRRLLGRRWYDVSAVLDLDGTFKVTQVPHAPLGDAGERVLKTWGTLDWPAVILAA
jgi:hypothetical protein